MQFTLPEASPLPRQYAVVVCARCGSGFADSDAQATTYDTYYRSFSKYADPAVATGGGEAPADLQRLEQLATDLSRQLPRHARILDVGCGNGGLLKRLRLLGFQELTGFDPSPICTARIHADAMNAESITLPLERSWWHARNESPFDLIVLSHVLEHLFDVKAALQSLIALLSPGGKVYIEVPDPTRYDTHAFLPLYFFDTEHINHLGPASFAFLADQLKLSLTASGPKTIRLPNGANYPALFCFLEAGGLTDLITTESLYGPLQDYVEQSIQRLAPLRMRILSLVGDDTPFVLWGAGSLAQRLIAEHWFPRHSLLAVVDRDSKKHGLQFAGTTILPPEIALRDLPNRTVILCAAAITTGEIKADYQALGMPYIFCPIVEDVH
ncbi:class I SAM-dependent methyltransferase [uncultured Thiodictyon sp.]|uniref:class I SAM-dependent methyltransferase n=1 Tax=uncultured Thiodictyon sp. TaxID=1846217 RepID=UPI002600E169|nr:class I SAM-dependent methyltransferase [uncultured Thiodictyon sp.]